LPVLAVVFVETVLQVLEVEGRRCNRTDRATYPVPVLTVTGVDTS
jgi:hypothetical protein